MVLKTLLAVPLLVENTKLRLALVMSTGAPLTLANEAIETTLIIADKTSFVKIIKHWKIFTECFTDYFFHKFQ